MHLRRHRPWRALFIACLLAPLAGCVARPPEPACATTPCPGPSEAAVEASAGAILFEDCVGDFAAASVPYDRIAALVPDAFIVDTGYTSSTAIVFLQHLHCPRATAEGRLFTEINYFDVAVTVIPRNETWRAPGLHRYVLDAIAEPLEFVTALRNASWPGGPGAFMTQGPPGAGYWSVKAPNATYEGPSVRTPAGDAYAELRVHYWHGAGPYARTDRLEATVRDVQAPPGWARSTGTSAGAAGIGPFAPAMVQAVTQRMMSWRMMEETDP